MIDPTQNATQRYHLNGLVHKGMFIFFLLTYLSSVSQEIEVPQTKELAIEKVYLHLDRSFYTAGEDIWFKAYVMDGRTHTPNTLSELVYVELVGPDDKIISKKTLKIRAGSTAGDFKLSPESKSGTYTVRAYTNYMRNFGISNFYTKEILVNTANSSAVSNDTLEIKNHTSLAIQFFPEGGYLFNGFLNPIAFKAQDSHGNSTSIAGKLMDDLGNVVTDFKSTHLGMGLFHFIPKLDRTYSALVFFNGKEERFEIPEALTNGVLMTITNMAEYYKIELRGTSDIKIKDYILIGKQKDLVRFNLAVNANQQENTTMVKLVKDNLDEGILELTLMDQENKPISERLLFHENADASVQAKIISSKNTYDKREQVLMEIALESLDLNSVTADMSLSVSNVAVNAAENQATTIKTYVLLNSVVRGEIEYPGYYFNENEPARKQHLDILMRTQGWRQYALEDELVQSSNYFLPEKGITLSGKVVDAINTTEPLTGSVSLTANSITEMIQDRAKTTEDGAFSFNNLNFVDTTTVLLSANVYYSNKKRNPILNYKIIFDSIPSPPILGAQNVAGPLAISVNSSPSKTIEKFTTGYEKAQQTTLSFLYNDKTIQLDEAIIAVKKEKKLDKYAIKRKVVPYKTPSQTVDFEGFTEMGFTNLLDALRGRVPGLTVRRAASGEGLVYLRAASSLGVGNAEGSGSALILLDGAPVGSAILEQMLPSNVDFIDVLKGPRAAIYGSRGANGVIAVYSKNGAESSRKDKKRGGSLNFEHPGYSFARTFYEPKYGSGTPEKKSVDSRTTLHWQPYIQMNTNGKASISFNTGDISGDYKVILEGITSDGTPIHSRMHLIIE